MSRHTGFNTVKLNELIPITYKTFLDRCEIYDTDFKLIGICSRQSKLTNLVGKSNNSINDFCIGYIYLHNLNSIDLYVHSTKFVKVTLVGMKYNDNEIKTYHETNPDPFDIYTKIKKHKLTGIHRVTEGKFEGSLYMGLPNKQYAHISADDLNNIGIRPIATSDDFINGNIIGGLNRVIRVYAGSIHVDLVFGMAHPVFKIE